MASVVPENMPQSNKTKNKRPKISLGNDNPNTFIESQTNEAQSPGSQKPTEKVPTYIVWSIFNLLLVPFGILCCYLTYKVKQFKAQNRYEIATKWSKRTFVCNIITTLLMAAVIITCVMLRYDYHQRNTEVPGNDTRTTGSYIPWQPGR